MGNNQTSSADVPSLYFPPPPPTPGEGATVEELKSALQPLIAGKELPEEMTSYWKLLKYLRGHGSVEAATAAFAATLEYRTARGVEAVRKELLEVEAATGSLPWPYELARFAPMMEVWKGVPPAVHHGVDAHGNLVTFTKMSLYNFGALIDAGLSDMWLELGVYCDVYFDLHIHRLCEVHGRPVARHDLVCLHGLGLTSIGFRAMALLKRMGESSEMYPEMIGRTTVCNAGRVGLALWKMARPFLPTQTAAKMMMLGTQFEDTLRESGIVDIPSGLARLDQQEAESAEPAEPAEQAGDAAHAD
jgi:hypothetical protein